MQINNYFLVRELISIVLLFDLCSYLPFFNIFFGTGYNKESFLTKKLGLNVIKIVWFITLIFLITGKYTLISSFILLIVFRHFYINNRWKGLFRGGGAPGFISYYSVLFIFLFELSFFLDPTNDLSKLVQLLFKVDFAFIMLCAGTYKSLVGYLKNEGMEYGCVNPLWGHLHAFFKKFKSDNFYLKLQNYFGSIGEIIIGLLLLIPNPSIQNIGAILCILSFVYLLPLIRLGTLPLLMIILPVLYFPNLGIDLFHSNHYTDNIVFTDQIKSFLKFSIMLYLFILPIVKFMQYYNLFLNRTFPQPLQNLLTRYANFIPIIIWRVFTADVINFFIRIYEVDKTTGSEKKLVHEDCTYSYFNWKNLILKLRYLQVTESITITSIFTTLKYFPSKRELFEEKLLKYSKTLPVTNNSILKYQYVSIQKNSNFEFLPVCNFYVDLSKEKVTQETLSPTFNPSSKAEHSPIRESICYGSYERAN